MKQLAFTYEISEAFEPGQIKVQIVEGVNREAALRKFILEEDLYMTDQDIEESGEDVLPLSEMSIEDLYDVLDDDDPTDGGARVLSILDIQDVEFIYSMAVG